MKIPLKYNLRSMWVRRVGTLMTAVGIGLTVAVLVAMMALVNGLDSTFVDTGYDTDLIVIRDGSQNEVNSYFNRDHFQTIKVLPGIARLDGNAEGEPMAVGEVIVVINHDRLDGEPSNVMIRGTSDMGFNLRPEIKLVEGRRFKKGIRELIVSKSLANRFQDMSLGDQLVISSNTWNIVGVFDAGSSAYNSEIWGDYDEIALAWTRPIYASILLRAENLEARNQLQQRFEEDRRLQELQVVEQKKYFAGQTISSAGIKALGFFIAIVMGVGSCFAAMNMMFGTVMSRFKEIGTLRSLGFRRRSILASFMLESIVLAVLGGVIGCLLALPVNGISTGTTNFATFSEVLFNFRITPAILAGALTLSAIVGILGGFLPAIRASRLKLIEVMRD